ncbi:MAG: Ig-like domain-containing protein [Nitrososphaerota archaeon]|nr:Ig-like domain-containing protein [Nitrososphaerota archaeon]MDG7023188.1 Ig-like domain-containing protein [Nitrososphaerota archaeon]
MNIIDYSWGIVSSVGKRDYDSFRLILDKGLAAPVLAADKSGMVFKIPIPKLDDKGFYSLQGMYFDADERAWSGLWKLYRASLYHGALHAAYSDFKQYANWAKGKELKTATFVVSLVEDYRATRKAFDEWPGILQVGSSVTIQRGQSAVVADVTTTSVSGSATVTAYTILNSVYNSASAEVKTLTPSPSAIGAFLAPAVLGPSPLQPSATLVLQLQDSSGNPAKARVATNITVTSSNTQVINGTLQVQVPRGESEVSLPMTPVQSGSTTFTVTSPGLKTTTVKFQAIDTRTASRLSSSAYSIFTDQTATVTLAVSIDGTGVSGANVTWFAERGTVSSRTSVTNAQGQASVTLTPAGVGVVNVTAVVSSPSVGSQKASIYIPVSVNPAANDKGILGTLLSFPYILILVGAAAAAAIVAFLFVRRRRRRSAEADEAFSEDEGSFSYLRTGPTFGPGGS